MSDSLRSVARAFAGLPQRPAVFDREVRRRAGQWWLESPIPVETIVDSFRAHEEFATRDGRLRVPIHEPDSGELTGEFLVYDPTGGAATVSFYDYSREQLVRIGLEEFGYTYPAWRIRFWSPRADPESVPSYLRNGDANSNLHADATSNPHSDATPHSPADALSNSPADATPNPSGDATPNPPDDATADLHGGATSNPSPEGRTRETPASTGQVEAEHTASSDEFFEDLRLFVEREREAERESTREAYESMTRRAFFDQHAGVRSVVPLGREVSDYGEQVVVLELADESGDEPVDVAGDYSLYPGSEVFVDRVDDGAGFPVEAELFEVAGRELHLGVYWDSSADKSAAESAFSEGSGAEFVVGALVNPVPFDRQLEAISDVESDDRKRAIVAGERRLATDESSYSRVGGDLNAVQQTAARAALRAEDVYCVHGPPGTGKTRTLTAIMRDAADRDLRVLACAHSNQAVDNLLVGSSTPDRPDPRSVHSDAVDGDVAIARVGNNSTNEIVTDRYVGGDRWQADVVGATMSAASDLAADMFDVAVIDEATQATIPSTCIPLAKAEKAVLAGDHKQLPPYHSDERHTVEQPELSLFEHLLGTYGADAVSTTLTRQYRMHEEIAAFPNEAFYDGVLTHGQRNRRWTIGSLEPVVAYDVAGSEERTPMKSYYNRAEAAVVADEVERLLESGVMPGEIGIITPYGGQVGIIRSALDGELDASRTADVEIDTIDSFQGGEREAVIVSFTRCNEDGAIGFLDLPIEGPRRLNVALTRARKRLVLIGNWRTLTADSSPDGARSYYRSLRSHLRSTNAFESDR